MLYLRGLRYIYQFNVFLYMFLSIAGISLLWMVVKGAGGPWRRKKAGAGREQGGFGELLGGGLAGGQAGQGAVVRWGLRPWR